MVLLDGTPRMTFIYDAQGRRTGMSNPEVSLSFVYDALNRITEATNQTLGQTIEYAYGANGNRTGMTGPLGTTESLYDAADRLVGRIDPATGTYRLGYDAAGRRTRLEYPNGVTTEYEYDGASRLLMLLTRNPQGQTLDGYRYTYSPVGNRTTMRSLRDDVLHEYSYDPVDRLTRWDRSRDGDVDRFEAYSYDQVGNRVQLDDERGTVTYSYDDANRLLEEIRSLTDGGQTTTSYTWDPDGNLTEEAVSTGSVTTYTWDALNRLKSLDAPSGTHTYGYDPNGIRVRETNGTETTRFLHAGEDILASYESGTLSTYYTHGPGIDEPWAQVSAEAPEPVAYLHRDALGSVTALSNTNAQLRGTNTYAAFGQVEQSTGLTSRYGYTSRELDPTGLMYYRARYYQPEVGRFTSRDSFGGLIDAPGTLHRYGYVQGNPTNMVDPSGHVALKLAGAIFLLTGLKMAYNFFSYLVPELQRIAELDVAGASLLEVFARVVLLLFVESVLLAAAYIYIRIGWDLLSWGRASFANFKFGRVAIQARNLANLIKAGGRSELWSLAITAGCINILSPLLASRSLSGRVDQAKLGLSMALCFTGATGILKARAFV